MDLLKVFDIKLMNLELKAKNKEEAIFELVQLLYDNKKIKSKEKFSKILLKREEIVSTGIGMGVALPHGKSAMVKEACIAVGRSMDGVEFNSLDHQPAHLIFLIALPENETEDTDYSILANISRKLAHLEVREKLLNAENEYEILKIFSKAETYDEK